MGLGESISYNFRNVEQDLPKLSSLFRVFCKSHDIPSDKVFDVELCVEELVTNVFSHGKNQCVLVSIGLNEDELKVTIEDKSQPFNLLRYPSKAPSDSIEDVDVGGLGIHLVKNLSDKIAYSGSKQGNKVTIFKDLR